jgi:hypothetical protein
MMMKAPFELGQEVRPTKELLEHYPTWALKHDRPCKVSSVEASFWKGAFQAWTVMIVFPDEPTLQYVVSHLSVK